MTTNSESYDLTPGVGVFALFPHMNYKSWYALAEFVDNAIDSYLLNQDRIAEIHGSPVPLRVVIKFEPLDGGEIRVWDNAGGISTSDYARAFHTAEPPPDSSGLSQYGVGMKSAAAWFANNLEVRTSAIDETVRRTTHLDFESIVRDNITEFTTDVRPCPADQHFTEILLTDLHHLPQTRTIGKIRTHLASMYREFTRAGVLELEFNGEMLEFDELEALVKPYYRSDGPNREWRKPVSIALQDGRVIEGFAGILATGSRVNAGLALFRNQRLIMGSADDSWRPKEIFGHTNTFRYQRVFGELNLDAFEVTHTKDGFRWDEVEEELLEALRAELDSPPLPLLDQAEGYRVRAPTPELRDEADKALDRAVEAARNVSDEVLDELVEADDEEVPASSLSDPDELTSEREFEIEVAGNRWYVTVDLTNDEADTSWLELAETGAGPGSSDLVCHIRLSLSHPFSQRFGGKTSEELEPLIRFAVGLGLAEAIARRSGVARAGTIRRNLNQLFDDHLSEA